MQVKIATLVNTLILGILAGLTFCVQLGLIPVLNSLNGSSYIKVTQGMIPPLTMAVKPLMIAGIITFLVRIIRHKTKWDFAHYCIIVAFLLFMAGGIITIAGNFPINNRLMALSTENPAAEWQDLRQKWNQFNSWRFVFAQVSFITGLIPILFYGAKTMGKKRDLSILPSMIAQ